MPTAFRAFSRAVNNKEGFLKEKFHLGSMLQETIAMAHIHLVKARPLSLGSFNAIGGAACTAHELKRKAADSEFELWAVKLSLKDQKWSKRCQAMQVPALTMARNHTHAIIAKAQRSQSSKFAGRSTSGFPHRTTCRRVCFSRNSSLGMPSTSRCYDATSNAC